MITAVGPGAELRHEERMCSETLEEAWNKVNTKDRATGQKLTSPDMDGVTVKDRDVRMAPLRLTTREPGTPISSHSGDPTGRAGAQCEGGEADST